MVLAAVTAAIGTIVGTLTGGTPDWALDGNLVFNGFVLANLIGIFIGFAIAMLLMNTAAAIVGLLRLQPDPADRGRVPRLPERRASRRSRRGSSSTPPRSRLFDGDYTPTGEEWAQIAVTGTIWLIIPLFLGIQRLLRIEFK